jgi:transposase
MPPDLKNKTREELALEIVQLRHENGDLKRMLFGQSTERFEGGGKEAVSKSREEDRQKSKQQTRKQKSPKPVKIHPGRSPLPESLERREVIIEPAENVEGMKCIGEEVTEELVYEPGYFWVRRYVRRKYVDQKTDKILIGELPARPIDKGVVSAELAAQIVVNKYCDHLPLYRQGKIFERGGIKIADSTLGEWLHTSVELLSPVYEALKKQVLESGYVQADETTIKVLDTDKKGSAHLGYYWVYHAPTMRAAVFDYRRGRSREGPQAFLEKFKGDLQCDGYEAYTIFEGKEDIRVHNCWAHARRYFEKALDEDQARAAHVMELIQRLYDVERRARQSHFTHEQRRQARQKEAVSVLQEIKKYLEQNKASALPKSLLGTAINYTLSRWDKLNSYTNDGKLEIDNNLVENAIRPVALGRKNYLFAGSHESAQRAAMIYSLISCCKICEVEPVTYFTDVFRKLPEYPVNQVQNLLPFNWKNGEG